jgi:hypothetical protein
MLGSAGRRPVRLDGVYLTSTAGARTGFSGACRGWDGLIARGRA